MEYEYTPEDFREISYSLHGTTEKTYYYEKTREQNEYFDSLNQVYGNNLNWQYFETLVKNEEIRVFKKPKSGYLGWFENEPTFGDDLLYSFNRYKYLMGKKMNEGKGNFRKNKLKYQKYLEENSEQFKDYRKYEKNEMAKKAFKKNFPKIILIYEKFIMENDEQLNDLLEHYISEKEYGANELYDLMLEEARRKYNFEKDQYNENIRKYNELSVGQKEKTRELGKHLDKFLLKLKPLIKDFKSKNRARDESLREKVLESEQKQADETKKKLQDEKKKQLQQYYEEIEDLEYKIKDAESKYSMNKAKLRKIDFKIKEIEKLKSQKAILEEKLKNKNLKKSLREKLEKQKARFDKIDPIYKSLRDQQQNLYSQKLDLGKFEEERIIRKRELDTYKKLNETSLRMKNANLRSLELEKKKQELDILEEQRYQEQKRQEEELKQAKIVFLKEKKLANKRIDQLKWESKSKNIKLQNVEKLNLDLEDQKQKLEEILAEKQSILRDKKADIERKKIQTLESQKQKAESQQLFTDSLKRDVDELQMEKDILKNISDNNKKILESTKQEISQRQKEIEKTISLNMESAKKNASEIYAKEAKMKLDVFQTLSEVKNQAALKTDVENTLEDLKDEILRKEAVENLLSDAIDSITNKEISEIENYNSYLESEINFKKKLADQNFTFAEKQEFLNDEKEDLIDRLEHVKSLKLKKIYQTREKAIEQQMKILLVEGADELKNETFSLKFDISNLEVQKEISERKEDLARFQADNAKKELHLRKQEIELLKNIRLQVIETERINLRNETKLAIRDMVIAAEKQEVQESVREKLDEILDDVEVKEISKSSKDKLNSIIDKIENDEIHDAVQQQVNVILNKIQLNEDVEIYKKNIKTFLEQIHDHTIYEEVEKTLDDIIDEIEFDDFDFLEDDDLDKLLKDVKKHISGEEKMERFLPKIREEDSKLKMDENIELQDRNRQEAPDEFDDQAETSFAEFNDYNLFVNNIENPEMRNKVKLILDKEDAFDKDKPEKMKKAYTKSINALWQTDNLDLNYWDGRIILDEKAKFDYEQKVNNINTALVDYDIHIDPTDQKIREFLDIKLTQTLTAKKKEINGYTFNGEQIISRNISRNFFFNYLRKPAACQKFIDELKEIINKTAKSQISAESYFDGKSVKDCAMEYIGELREEQTYQMENARNGKAMKQALRDGNDIEQEIKLIKKNMPFKMRLKIFRRTLSWRFTKLLRLLWKHKGKTAAIIFTLFSFAIGVALNQLGVVAIVHNLKKAANNVKQYANDVHDMGKRIIHNIQALYGLPGKIMGWALVFLGIFLRIVYFTTRMSGTASTGLIFAILGGVMEITIYFSGNIETINEKTVEILEETGNTIEDVGIRAQKTISKNMPRWYYDKPPEERTILQHVEAAAANVTFKLAQGTELTGKKVQQAGEVMSHTLFYMQALLALMFALIILSFIRNNLL